MKIFQTMNLSMLNGTKILKLYYADGATMQNVIIG